MKALRAARKTSLSIPRATKHTLRRAKRISAIKSPSRSKKPARSNDIPGRQSPFQRRFYFLISTFWFLARITAMKRFLLACLLPTLLFAQDMQLTEQLGKTVLYGDIAVSPDGAHL